MNHFIYIVKAIFIGLATGFFISIPLGPAGIESVKRTVSVSYREGLTVSLGALTADFSYLLLINYGLSNLLSINKRTEALFWIISGGILFIIGYQALYNLDLGKKFDFANKLKFSKPLPFITGFLITFSNPMTPSLWLFLSGTVIRPWYYISLTAYYVFMVSIMAGMVLWFVLLNYLALKGVNVLPSSYSNLTSTLLQISILIIGVGFIIFGIIKLIF